MSSQAPLSPTVSPAHHAHHKHKTHPGHHDTKTAAPANTHAATGTGPISPVVKAKDQVAATAPTTSTDGALHQALDASEQAILNDVLNLVTEFFDDDVWPTIERLLGVLNAKLTRKAQAVVGLSYGAWIDQLFVDVMAKLFPAGTSQAIGHAAYPKTDAQGPKTSEANAKLDPKKQKRALRALHAWNGALLKATKTNKLKDDNQRRVAKTLIEKSHTSTQQFKEAHSLHNTTMVQQLTRLHERLLQLTRD